MNMKNYKYKFSLLVANLFLSFNLGAIHFHLKGGILTIGCYLLSNLEGRGRAVTDWNVRINIDIDKIFGHTIPIH